MKQVLIGGYYDALNVSASEYNLVSGGTSWYGAPDNAGQCIPTSGTIRNLRVKINDVPGTGTYTFTLYRKVGAGAWGDTILTCTIAADGTSAYDTEHEVTVAAGDVVCLKCTPDSPDNARYARWTFEFEGDTTNESILLLAGFGLMVGTRYMSVMGQGWDTDENQMRGVCPTSGKIKNLYVQLNKDPGTTPEAYRFTLRVNGVDSDDGEGNPLQCTVTADGVAGNDTTHEIIVSAGDTLTFMAEPLNSPSVSALTAIGMVFLADTDGESITVGTSYDDLDNAATEYNILTGYRAALWTATEAQRYQLAQACTLKKLYLLLSGSPGTDKKYTFTVRRNAVSPANGLVVEIAGAATTGNDTTHTIAISDGDEVSLMCVPDGIPDVRDAYWGVVGYIEPVAPPVGLENKSANMAAKMVAAGLI